MTLRGAVWPTALCAATVLVWVLTTPARAADGLVECGSVITEDTVLTRHLRDCENGLIVAAPDVTLDLGGHRIVGRGAGVGVTLQAVGTRVQNDSIRGFEVGVSLDRTASGTTVSHLHLSSNATGVRNLVGGAVRIEHSTIRENGEGIALGFIFGESHVIDNRILGNSGAGIWAYRAPLQLQGNDVRRNGGGGAYLDSSHAVVIENAFTANGGDGLVVRDEICGHLNFFRVGANEAFRNQGLGINVRQDPNCPPGSDPFDLLDTGGNAANHNGDAQQCTIHVQCAPNRGQADRFASLSPADASHPPVEDEQLAEDRLRSAESS